jgi:excisionase family DNA binding protein
MRSKRASQEWLDNNLNPADVCKILGVSNSTVRGLASSGHLTHRRREGDCHMLFRRDDINKFMETQRYVELRNNQQLRLTSATRKEIMKKVFTTGQVAQMCKVAPRTVSKWFDSGQLKGYRIPGSQDRRIPREQLVKFLKENQMPLGELEEEEWHKILLIGTDGAMNDRMRELLPAGDRFKFEHAATACEAGILSLRVNGGCESTVVVFADHPFAAFAMEGIFRFVVCTTTSSYTSSGVIS